MSAESSAPDDARRRHFGHFYELDEPTAGGPVVLVTGNCQAESTRIMLAAGDLCTVRMPAVHELTRDDLPHLDRWLARASALVAQPVRDDYHGMPLGTRQLAARMPAGARTVVVPVIRFAGLYPAHAIVRPPSDPSLGPPLVEYHDLHVLAEAAGTPLRPLEATAVHAVAELSLGELRRREVAHDTIVVSDLFAAPTFDAMRTLNHPGNAVFATVAARVRGRLGLEHHVVDPGRPLLSSVHAPREAATIEAWGLDDEPSDAWTVDGRTIPSDEVRRTHLEWYARHPDVVAAGLARHAEALRVLA